MKVYVAGASAEIDRAQRWIRELTHFGFEVTLDWTIPVAQHGSAPSEHEERLRYALADLEVAARDAEGRAA